MTRKSEQETFIDMLKRFGEDLKMPNVDVERIIDHHRKNLETLEKTARAASAGASSVMSRQREMLQDTLREVTEMVQDMGRSGSPQDMVSKQAEFARRSFESAVKNASEMADVVRQSSVEAVDILRARIKEAMDDLRDGPGGKK